MIHEVVDIKVSTFDEPAKLYLYLLDNSPEIDPHKLRPLILICPGGGYAGTSDREAEPVAMQFLAKGCHAAVLRYSCAPARYPTALLQLGASVKYLREHAAQWNIAAAKLFVQGFSAGGHLAAAYGVFWKKKSFLAKMLDTDADTLRPNGLLLCYPVITSGPYAHRESFENLLGSRHEELAGEMSLENQVDADTPPAFLWHTAQDDCVPVENSVLFFQALHRCQIPAELHIFPYGGHGLGLADEQTAAPDGYGIQKECQSWMALALAWLGKEQQCS